MSSARPWLVKIKRAGRESILSSWASRRGAEAAAESLNHSYQTDEYYVEEWKEAPGV